MRKRRYTVLVIWLLLSTLWAGAQDGQTADSVVAIIEPSLDERRQRILFDSIKAQPVISLRKVPQKKVDSLKKADDFWYANLEPIKKKETLPKEETKQNSVFQKKWFRNLLWTIILFSFIGVVIWYLISSNILLFRKKAKKIIDEETNAEDNDIFKLDYAGEIAAAEKEQNYRMAVRLLYLQLLKVLAEKELIDYRYGRTNQDYVMQMSGSSYHRDFFCLTRNFEYTWYGQFNLSAAAYNMMRDDFSNFQNKLRP